jgi:hypothetical protein
MPKENFYDSSTRIESDGLPPDLVVAWGESQPKVTINGIGYDRSGLNRLIGSLRKARNQTYGVDE